MRDHFRTLDLLTDLHEIELELLRHHRIRLRVDKLTTDGLNALCSATQVERRFLRADHATDHAITLCHEALAALHIIDLRPLISWSPRNPPTDFSAVDPDDPFLLKTALIAAGMAHRLLPLDPYARMQGALVTAARSRPSLAHSDHVPKEHLGALHPDGN